MSSTYTDRPTGGLSSLDSTNAEQKTKEEQWLVNAAELSAGVRALTGSAVTEVDELQQEIIKSLKEAEAALTPESYRATDAAVSRLNNVLRDTLKHSGRLVNGSIYCLIQSGHPRENVDSFSELASVRNARMLRGQSCHGEAHIKELESALTRLENEGHATTNWKVPEIALKAFARKQDVETEGKLVQLEQRSMDKETQRLMASGIIAQSLRKMGPEQFKLPREAVKPDWYDAISAVASCFDTTTDKARPAIELVIRNRQEFAADETERTRGLLSAMGSNVVARHRWGPDSSEPMIKELWSDKDSKEIPSLQWIQESFLDTIKAAATYAGFDLDLSEDRLASMAKAIDGGAILLPCDNGVTILCPSMTTKHIPERATVTGDKATVGWAAISQLDRIVRAGKLPGFRIKPGNELWEGLKGDGRWAREIATKLMGMRFDPECLMPPESAYGTDLQKLKADLESLDAALINEGSAEP